MFSRKTPLCWGGERRRDTTKHTAQKKRGEKKSYRDFLCLFAFEYRSIVVAVDGFAGLEIKFMHVCFSSLFSLLLLWYQTVSWYFSIYYTHITSKPKPEPAHLFLYGELLTAACSSPLHIDSDELIILPLSISEIIDCQFISTPLVACCLFAWDNRDCEMERWWRTRSAVCYRVSQIFARNLPENDVHDDDCAVHAAHNREIRKKRPER